jgi:hypothetical protein
MQTSLALMKNDSRSELKAIGEDPVLLAAARTYADFGLSKRELILRNLAALAIATLSVVVAWLTHPRVGHLFVIAAFTVLAIIVGFGYFSLRKLYLNQFDAAKTDPLYRYRWTGIILNVIAIALDQLAQV